MSKKETYTHEEIISIIDEEIRKTSERKNKYIEKNGYTHTDTINSFDTAISTLLCLYSKF